MASDVSGNYPTSSVDYTGNRLVDGLLEGVKWGGPMGTEASLTYDFPASTHPSLWPGYDSSYLYRNLKGFRPLDDGTQQAVGDALDEWAKVADIKFQPLSDTTEVGNIRLYYQDLSDYNTRGAHGVTRPLLLSPYKKLYDGDIGLDVGNYQFNNDYYLKSSSENNYDPNDLKVIYETGSKGYKILLHEIGHALGLDHSDRLPEQYQNLHYTVMAILPSNDSFVWPTTPMLLDILALQKLYGPNTTTADGPTRYTFSNNINYPDFKTIWDAGGEDTFDASNQVDAVRIDLRPGTFSTIGGGLTSNIAIAFDTWIENAVGTPNRDIIRGNKLDNDLFGDAGRDFLVGGKGRDILDGGGDVDTVSYRDMDLKALHSLGVSINLETGVSTLRADIQGWSSFRDYYNWSITTAANNQDKLISIEDVIGTAGDDNIVGDANNNQLIGYNGNDTLIGGEGNDELNGGKGDDTLEGDVGNDTLNGGRGRDTLNGGGDVDIADYGDVDLKALHSLGVSINLETGVSTLRADFQGWSSFRDYYNWSITTAANNQDKLTSIENVIGTAGDDNIVGDANNNQLIGNNGNDTMEGGRGNDFLGGGAGDDTLWGNAGNDSLFGHTGADTIVLEAGAGTDTVWLFTPGEDVFGLAGGLTFGDLSFNQVFGDVEILAGFEVIAMINGVSVDDVNDVGLYEILI